MKGEDRELGMDRPISRRDFVQGVAAVVSATAVASGPVTAFAENGGSPAGQPTASTYPPLRTGLRGDPPGSFEAAPGMNLILGRGDNFPTPESTGEVYDLVVVGGGLSGLAAAYFYRKRFGASARILVLDNLDDFGGHAKRNEFIHNGHQLIAAGGSDYLVAPHTWPREAIGLIEDLGIDWRHPRYGEPGIQSPHDLKPATFFRKEVYGRDKLVVGSTPMQPTAEFLAQMPVSEQVKTDLVRLMTGKDDYLAGMTAEEKYAKLHSMSYRDYLLNVVKVHPDVLAYTGGVWCLGNDMASAWLAFFRHKPGFDGLDLKRPDMSPEGAKSEGEDFHMPAGNSDVARLIVRALIPDALPAGDYRQVETLRANYAALDVPGSPTRIRLSSIVVRTRHLGAMPQQFQPDTREVEVCYVKDGYAKGGKVYSVRAANVVMACMNNVVPFLCPEMPDIQKTALRDAVRAANQQTNVLFRNWEAFAKLGVGHITCPNSFYGSFGMSAPRLMGAMKPIRDPSEPVLVAFGTGLNSGILSNPTMMSVLTGGHNPATGTDMDDQFRACRYGLLKTPFETFERAVRTQAAGALAGTDFDPARDIVAITVNRWPHGFATGRNVLFDKTGPNTVAPNLIATRKWGRITIANSDAARVGLATTAIYEAWRAVSDLETRDYGYYETF